MNAVQSTSLSATSTVAGTCAAGAPELRMLVLMVQTQLVQGETAKVDINLSQDKLKELREQVREAIEQAREAEEDSGFFGAIGDVLGGDVATIAQVVAIAAAAVVTCGAAAVLATIAIACTLASKYGEELGIPPKVAMGLGIAAAVASIASGNVGGAAGAATTTSTTSSVAAGAASAAVPGVACGTALANGGLVATATAASRVTWLTDVAKDVGFVANIVAPAASGAGTGFRVVGAYYHGQAIDHDADAKQAQSQETLENMDIETALDIFERAVDRQLAVTSQGRQLIEANQRSDQLIISGVA